MGVFIADPQPMDGGSANPVPPIGRQQISVGGCFLETAGIEGSAAPLVDQLLRLAGRGLRETGKGCSPKMVGGKP